MPGGAAGGGGALGAGAIATGAGKTHAVPFQTGCGAAGGGGAACIGGGGAGACTGAVAGGATVVVLGRPGPRFFGSAAGGASGLGGGSIHTEPFHHFEPAGKCGRDSAGTSNACDCPGNITGSFWTVAGVTAVAIVIFLVLQ